MANIYSRGKNKKKMDVLWGAWVKEVNHTQNCIDIIGIYDDIWKTKRGDFPFTVDLKALVAYQANSTESDKTFHRTLTIMDIDARPIFSDDSVMIIPTVLDTPYRWYEEYVLKGVVIKEPAYYQLSILINQEEKQVIPLRVLAPKRMIWNPEDDSTIEEWIE